MPSNTGLAFAHAGAVDPAARRKRPRLKLGVFSHGGAWKVYEEFDAPASYPTRLEAIAAAKERAFAEASGGRPVDFFIEEEDGALRQIDLH